MIMCRLIMERHRFNMKNKTAYIGTLLAFSLILSYIESLIPFYFGIPGAKLGLANFAILFTLYLYGWKEALLVDILKVLLSGFMFGNLFMILYSMAGAICSFIVMCLLKKTRHFSIMGVSVGGGVCHNIGQLLIAVLVTQTPGVLYYLPVLLVLGTVTGLLIGLITSKVLKHMKGWNNNI